MYHEPVPDMPCLWQKYLLCSSCWNYLCLRSYLCFCGGNIYFSVVRLFMFPIRELLCFRSGITCVPRWNYLCFCGGTIEVSVVELFIFPWWNYLRFLRGISYASIVELFMLPCWRYFSCCGISPYFSMAKVPKFLWLSWRCRIRRLIIDGMANLTAESKEWLCGPGGLEPSQKVYRVIKHPQ